MRLAYNKTDLLDCVQLAILLEVSGYPKPGNIHRTRDYIDTRFEHFLVGGVVIREAFELLCNNSIDTYRKRKNYNNFNLGKYIKMAVEKSITWQSGGNTNLGAILLLIPLCATASLHTDKNSVDIDEFRDELDQIIKNSIYIDTINLYKAIEIAKPGGMGKINDYDIYDSSSLEKIKAENINLFKIFNFSKDRDSIAREWISKFQITFEIGFPYFQEIFKISKDINIATVHTFLKIASKVPDTLIIRQFGEKLALEYSQCANQILIQGGLLNKSARNKFIKWENNLLESKFKINPGTTADLTVSTLFISLLSGIRF